MVNFTELKLGDKLVTEESDLYDAGTIFEVVEVNDNHAVLENREFDDKITITKDQGDVSFLSLYK